MRRIEEIDFLKCVLIILMVIFHLGYFADQYPYAKDLVYTFHMPGFLLISGYLSPTWSPGSIHSFLHKKLKWLFVPYLVMEFSYACASAFLPVRIGIGFLSAQSLTNALFLHPIGPYWYLHTLIICYIIYFFASYIKRYNGLLAFFISAIVLYGFSTNCIRLIEFSSAFYFLIGAATKYYKTNFLKIFLPKWWMILPFGILAIFPTNFDRLTLGGIIIVYTAICGIMGCYQFIKTPKIKDATLFIGRNSLLILLFSPIFTMGAKVLIPLFHFDRSGICFMIVATIISIYGSFVIGKCLNFAKVSRFLFGRENAFL